MSRKLARRSGTVKPRRGLFAQFRKPDYDSGMVKRAARKNGVPRADPLIVASEEAAKLLKAMASPVRLRILCLLAEGEMTVGGLAQRLGIRDQATSQQLAQLRLERLVVARKDGQRVHYVLASAAIERVLATLRDIYCPEEGSARQR